MKCAIFWDDGNHLLLYAISDPPYALTPKANLGPGPTISIPIGSQSTAPPATPKATPLPIISQTSNSPETQQIRTIGPLLIPNQGQPSLDPGKPVASQPTVDPAVAQSVIEPSEPVVGPGQPQLLSTPSSTVQSTPVVSIISNSQDRSSPTVPTSLNVGAIIYSAFDGPPFTVAITPSALESAVISVGRSALTVQPSEIVFGSSTLKVNGPAATIAGTPVSIASTGIMIGTDMIDPNHLYSSVSTEPIDQPRPEQQPYTAVGLSSIALDGITLMARSDAVTISGDVYSVAPSGNVIVRPVGEASAEIFTFDSQTFTANPSAIAVDRTTLTVGGTEIVISSISIHLESGSMLVIGTNTIKLFSDPASASAHNYQKKDIPRRNIVLEHSLCNYFLYGP